MYDQIDNNAFEIIPSPRVKRKTSAPCPTAYMNPGLDLLATEDAICNTVMEIKKPTKKRKRSKSCGEETASFENTALDLGGNKQAVHALLLKELQNVKHNILQPITERETEHEYMNLQEVNDELNETNQIVNHSSITNTTCESKTILQDNSLPIPTTTYSKDFTQVSTNLISQQIESIPSSSKQVIASNGSAFNLSFLDRLGIDSPTLSNQSLYLDDDLNESNIMEIKTITIITTKKKRLTEKNIVKNTNPFLNSSFDSHFLPVDTTNIFCNYVPNTDESNKSDTIVYNDESILGNDSNLRPNSTQIQPFDLMPRRLFPNDITNSTISTLNEISMINNENEYVNVDSGREEMSNKTVDFNTKNTINKQSKILGYDVSKFNQNDILNINNTKDEMNEVSYCSIQSNDTANSLDTKKNSTFLRLPILKASNKLSKKVLNKIKKTFKNNDRVTMENNVTLNPYEVPRKVPKYKVPPKPEGFENPALKLDNSDELEDMEDDDEEHQYETIKTARNTMLNTNITPLKMRNNDGVTSNTSYPSMSETPGKKHVRFDSTLNREKIITGNSFDSASAIETQTHLDSLDSQIDGFHDELENCINEKKFIAFNM